MKYNGVISAKLALFEKYLDELARIDTGNFESFKSNFILKKGIERCFQVLCEIMIDLSQRLISLSGQSPAATSAEAIDKLVGLKILPAASPYREMIKFRNVLVHNYDSLDDTILFGIKNRRLDDFRTFLKAIKDHVSN